jgi:TolB-like protein/DNA-binding winged helix-turn-helix (wHTH) protein
MGHRIATGVFEIDLSAGQVFRQGQRVPVQDQPFRVLAMLLERPGQIVTRGELQARIWSADTYVGFDEGLNTAIRKLRILFGDSAENPRFIETIPRRGYRFMAPVTEISPVGAPSDIHPKGALASASLPLRVASGLREGETTPSLADSVQPPPRASGRWIWPILASTGAILIAALVSRVRQHDLPQPQTHARHENLAVLPFQNLSNDPSQDYFSDGLTEETITDLGQLSPAQLGVIARTSAMAYKHTDKTVGQIGHDLSVDYILEGSVRREPGRARISAQLIRVSDQTHLWAHNYDVRNLSDLIDVQNSIAGAIADAVQLNVTQQHQREIARAHPVSPQAYDLYLKGLFYLNQRTRASMATSIELFKQSTKVDPGFAQGYAGLAYAYDISNIIGSLTSKESLPEAKTAAMRAIELDPSLDDAYAALGMEISHYEFDLPAAREAFQKALAINPSSVYAHFLYSNCYLTPMGHRKEAVAENRKALELDPLSLPINNFLGETYLLAGDYAAAEQQFKRTITMDPNFPLSHIYLAELYREMGRFKEAIEEEEEGDLLSGSSPKEAAEKAASLLRAFNSGGEKGYWTERLSQDIHSMERRGGAFSPVIMAYDYAQAGEKDKAFEWLEKAYDAREGGELTLMAVDPVWKNLHGDPRFAGLLRRIGLPQLDAIEPPVHMSNGL